MLTVFLDCGQNDRQNFDADPRNRIRAANDLVEKHATLRLWRRCCSTLPASFALVILFMPVARRGGRIEWEPVKASRNECGSESSLPRKAVLRVGVASTA